MRSKAVFVTFVQKKLRNKALRRVHFREAVSSVAVWSTASPRTQGDVLGMDEHVALFAVNGVQDALLGPPVGLNSHKLVQPSTDVPGPWYAVGVEMGVPSSMSTWT